MSQGEQNIETLCANIKAKGVTIFTIAYNITEQATRDRLRNCATKPAFYYEPYNGEQLFTVFAGIGFQINPESLRLSQ